MSENESWRPVNWEGMVTKIYREHAFDRYTTETLTNAGADAMLEVLRKRGVTGTIALHYGSQWPKGVVARVFVEMDTVPDRLIEGAVKGQKGTLIFITDEVQP